MSLTMEICLLTQKKFLPVDPSDWYLSQIHQEDTLLSTALARLGHTTRRVDWSDPAISWAKVPLAVFRSNWDYFHRHTEFNAWLKDVQGQTPFVNALEVIRWNMHKGYLLELEGAGIPIVPTYLIRTGDTRLLSRHMEDCGFTEGVVKPAVSGGARYTWRLKAGEEAPHEDLFSRLIACEDMLLQPFMPEIETHGELSLMILGGTYTHAVIKRAKSGDFRVQDDFGGVVSPYDASKEARDLAEAAVRAAPGDIVYARVDLVPTREGFALMELELIEPELFMRFHPSSATVFAEAIARQIVP